MLVGSRQGWPRARGSHACSSEGQEPLPLNQKRGGSVLSLEAGKQSVLTQVEVEARVPIQKRFSSQKGKGKSVKIQLQSRWLAALL